MVAYKGNVLASDMTGGFSSLEYDDSPLPLCADRKRPVSRVDRAHSSVSVRRLLLRGTAGDKGCAGTAKTRERVGAVRKVSVAVALKSDGRCRYVSKKGTLGARRNCKTPVFLTARGTSRWRLDLRGAFKRGSYVVSVRSRDGAGNAERTKTATLRVRASASRSA